MRSLGVGLARSVLALLAVASAGCRCPECPPAPSDNCTYTAHLYQAGTPATGAGLPATGGSFNVDLVVSAGTCPVSTHTPDPWITITHEPADRGPHDYRISAAANPGARRTGVVYIGYQAVKVDQAGAAGSGCTFSVFPATAQAGAAGGPMKATIVPSDENCGWTLERFPASAEDVVSEPSPRYGLGTRTVSYTVRSDATPPPLPREGSFRVKDTAAVVATTHTLTQQ
jgi:hypothetical protein